MELLMWSALMSRRMGARGEFKQQLEQANREAKEPAPTSEVDRVAAGIVVAYHHDRGQSVAVLVTRPQGAMLQRCVGVIGPAAGKLIEAGVVGMDFSVNIAVIDWHEPPEVE